MVIETVFQILFLQISIFLLPCPRYSLQNGFTSYLLNLVLSSFIHPRCSALVDNPNARKHQNHGDDFLPCQVVEANDNANDGGNGGLHVVVHADHSGTQAFLPYGNQEIGDKSGKNHHKGHLPKHFAFHLPKRHADEMPRVERQGHQHGKQEHPLHEGDHIIL